MGGERELVAAPLGDDRRFTGEGARWDPTHGDLLWVDVWAGHVLRTDARGRTTLVHVMMPPVGFAELRGEAVLIGAGLQLLLLDGDRTRLLTTVPDAAPGARINDGRIAPDGSVWFGTVTPSGGGSSLWSWRPGDTAPRREMTGLGTANGIDWSPDGRTMYLADTTSGIIHACSYTPSAATASAPRTYARMRPGAPDGLCVAPDGAVWVAEIFEGRAVEMLDGQVRRTVRVDCPRVTSVALSGTGALYLTTGRKDLGDDVLHAVPESGSIYRAMLDRP